MNQRKLFAATAIISFFASLTACATPMYQAIDEIHPGMDKADVLEKAGGPKLSERWDGKDHWIYHFQDEEEKKSASVVFLRGSVVAVKSQSREPTLKDLLQEADTYDEYVEQVGLWRKRLEDSNFKDIDD